MCCQWRLRSDPVHMLSKNFLATHQVDIDLWTEFLYVACRANCPSHLVCKKRAFLGRGMLVLRPVRLPV
jgi:hypothetical protein